MRQGESFFNLYSHDLVRVAVATPEVQVADSAFNGRQTIEEMRRAAQQQAILMVFPELGLPACDYRAPSDAASTAWLRALDPVPDIE